jgi:hypothetical protein
LTELQQPGQSALTVRAIKLFKSCLLAAFSCALNAGCAKTEPAPAPTPKPSAEAAPVVARLQAGRFKVGTNEANEPSLAKDIKFTEPFQAVPVVVVTPSHFDPHPDIFAATVVNTTTTGFRVLIHRADVPVAGWGLELNIEWVAVDYGGGVAKLLGGP